MAPMGQPRGIWSPRSTFQGRRARVLHGLLGGGLVRDGLVDVVGECGDD